MGTVQLMPSAIHGNVYSLAHTRIVASPVPQLEGHPRAYLFRNLRLAFSFYVTLPHRDSITIPQPDLRLVDLQLLV